LLGLRRAGPLLTAHLVGSAALSYAATSQAFPSSHTDEDFGIKYNIQNGGSAPEQVTKRINIDSDVEDLNPLAQIAHELLGLQRVIT